MQYVALLLIHVYIVIGRSEMGDVSMCRYRRYMYIWSPATVYADDNICWRQFVQHVLSLATIYAGDNICRNRRFYLAGYCMICMIPSTSVICEWEVLGEKLIYSMKSHVPRFPTLEISMYDMCSESEILAQERCSEDRDLCASNAFWKQEVHMKKKRRKKGFQTTWILMQETLRQQEGHKKDFLKTKWSYEGLWESKTGTSWTFKKQDGHKMNFQKARWAQDELSESKMGTRWTFKKQDGHKMDFHKARWAKEGLSECKMGTRRDFQKAGTCLGSTRFVCKIKALKQLKHKNRREQVLQLIRCLSKVMFNS